MCHHESEAAAEDALWGIINPDINTSVPKDRVLKIIDMMIYYSTDVPYNNYNTEDKTKVDQSIL